MKFLSKNYVSNESDAGGYALITLDDTTVKTILERKELHQMVKSKDNSLMTLEFWGGEAEFFDCYVGQLLEETLTAKEWEGLEDCSLIRVSDSFELPDDKRTRTDCDRMVVREDGITWSASCHYGSGTFETRELSFDEMITSVFIERVAPAMRRKT